MNADKVILSFFATINNDRQFIQALKVNQDGTARIKEWFVSADKIPAVINTLAALNVDNYSIYFTAAKLTGDRLDKTNKNDIKYKGSYRDSAHFISNQFLYIDMDTHGDENYKQLMQDVAAGITPKPSLIVNTSQSKYHAYWRLKQPLTDIDTHKAYLRTLQLRYNADPASVDSIRLLRVPGFRHPGKNSLVKLLINSKTTHDLSKFEATFEGKTQKNIIMLESDFCRAVRQSGHVGGDKGTQDWKDICGLIASNPEISDEKLLARLRDNHSGTGREKHMESEYYPNTILNAREHMSEELKKRKLSLNL